MGKHKIHLKNAREQFTAETQNYATTETVLVSPGLTKAGFDILSSTVLLDSSVPEDERIEEITYLTSNSDKSNPLCLPYEIQDKKISLTYTKVHRRYSINSVLER